MLPGSLKRLPLLTREEELKLSREYRDTGDPRIAQKLVESHLRLVAKIARQSCSRRSMLPDVFQEGVLGLMRAVQKYDPERGIRLSSYAAWWIRAYIFQHIMANTRIMRVATTFAQRKIYFNLNRETARLRRDGKEPDAKELAASLKVPEATVIEMTTRLAGREVQFDTTLAVEAMDAVGAGGSVPLRPDEDVQDRELQAAVRRRVDELLRLLEPRERIIFEQRLLTESPATLRDLGQQFGISRERARQIEERLKKRLRPILQDLLSSDSGTAQAA